MAMDLCPISAIFFDSLTIASPQKTKNTVHLWPITAINGIKSLLPRRLRGYKILYHSYHWGCEVIKFYITTVISGHNRNAPSGHLSQFPAMPGPPMRPWRRPGWRPGAAVRSSHGDAETCIDIVEFLFIHTVPGAYMFLIILDHDTIWLSIYIYKLK